MYFNQEWILENVNLIEIINLYLYMDYITKFDWD